MSRVLLAALLVLAAACHELPQNVVKPFAGKAETQLYDGPLFKGDKARFEKALAARTKNENEYVRMGDAPTQ